MENFSSLLMEENFQKKKFKKITAKKSTYKSYSGDRPLGSRKPFAKGFFSIFSFVIS